MPQVLGQFGSPYSSNHFTARLALTAAVGNGHVTRSPATRRRTESTPHVAGSPRASSGSQLDPGLRAKLTHYALTSTAPPPRGRARAHDAGCAFVDEAR